MICVEKKPFFKAELLQAHQFVIIFWFGFAGIAGLLLLDPTLHGFIALHAAKSMEKSIKLELLFNFAPLL